MISIYSLKSKFQNILRPLVKNFYQMGITANQVTLFACLGSILLAVAVVALLPRNWGLLFVPVWMFIRMALNAIDGMLAREYKQKSSLGAYLNELGDVVADTALFAIFLFIPGISLGGVLAIIFLAIISEYSGVMAPLVGADRRYDGPMGKSDRAFIFGALSFFLGLGILPIYWVNIIFCFVSVLLLYTIFNRIRNGISEALNKE